MTTTEPRFGTPVTVEEGRFSSGAKYYTAIALELPNCLYQADAPEKAVEGLFDLIEHMVPMWAELGIEVPTPAPAGDSAD